MLLRALFLPLLSLAGIGFHPNWTLCACMCVLSVVKFCFPLQELCITCNQGKTPCSCSLICMSQLDISLKMKYVFSFKWWSYVVLPLLSTCEKEAENLQKTRPI